MKAHGYFKWAYPVTGSGIYLSLIDGENNSGIAENQTATNDGLRSAEVEVYCDGPNLGSAGGATLQPLGAIALVTYQGLLIIP